MTASLAMQRQAVEHLLALHEDAASTVAASVRDACRTLAWMEKRQELIRAIADLNKRAPALAAILLEFPDAQIVDVRVPEKPLHDEGPVMWDQDYGQSD